MGVLKRHEIMTALFVKTTMAWEEIPTTPFYWLDSFCWKSDLDRLMWQEVFDAYINLAYKKKLELQYGEDYQRHTYKADKNSQPEVSRSHMQSVTCAVCGGEIVSKRPHTKTCSSKCRKALSRRNDEPK